MNTDQFLAAWRARHPWAYCSDRVAKALAELEATYGCRCGPRPVRVAR